MRRRDGIGVGGLLYHVPLYRPGALLPAGVSTTQSEIRLPGKTHLPARQPAGDPPGQPTGVPARQPAGAGCLGRGVVGRGDGGRSGFPPQRRCHSHPRPGRRPARADLRQRRHRPAVGPGHRQAAPSSTTTKPTTATTSGTPNCCRATGRCSPAARRAPPSCGTWNPASAWRSSRP